MMTAKLERARRYAKVAHDGQKYGDEFPYIIHLQTAYMVGVMFGITDEDVLTGILLHDVLEDTDREYDEILTLFGQRVADMVATVTEPTGLTRKERHAISYPKIRVHTDARLLKLCDRISHVEFGGKKVSMYRKEHATFKAAILPSSMTYEEQKMWHHLDNLLAEVR